MRSKTDGALRIRLTEKSKESLAQHQGKWIHWKHRTMAFVPVKQLPATHAESEKGAVIFVRFALSGQKQPAPLPRGPRTRHRLETFAASTLRKSFHFQSFQARRGIGRPI